VVRKPARRPNSQKGDALVLLMDSGCPEHSPTKLRSAFIGMAANASIDLQSSDRRAKCMAPLGSLASKCSHSLIIS
jgi:hypothetical protein